MRVPATDEARIKPTLRRMGATPRRYLEGYFAGVNARGGHGPHATPPPDPEAGASDPWRTLLACAEGDRPPRAAERAGLASLGVVDLAPGGRDGCRLQLRAPLGRLLAWQLRELAAVSQEAAGGFIETGERGGPELAVVGWREAAGTLARLRAAGLAGGGNVLRCSPAAGLDAGEIYDVTRLALTLDAALAGGGPRVGLDGGARGWPAPGEGDDLTLRAAVGAGAETIFQVIAGGMRFGVPAARAGSATVALAERFQQNGGGWEGLDAETVRGALDGSPPAAPEVSARVDPGLTPGTFAQKQPGLCALVAAGPADGLWRSRALVALAGLAEAEGAGEARLWAGGGVLVPGVPGGRAAEARVRLAEIVAVVR